MDPAIAARCSRPGELLGLGREIFDPVRTFSGGMLRKLEIVRSLIHRPRVLFLDEPTTGLDAPSRRTLWEHLRAVRQEHGTTIVLTSHYLEEAEQADRICIIDAGRGARDRLARRAQGGPRGGVARSSMPTTAPRLRAELDGAADSRRRATGRSGSTSTPARPTPTLRAIETPLTLVRTHAPIARGRLPRDRRPGRGHRSGREP